LDDLSRFISKRGENLLVEILDFLVQLMRHKEANQMDAYHLGEAMGKVTLGPADCDPIIAEKAGHFLTRMIIEHSKAIHGEKQLLFRVDSGFAWPVITNCKKQPMSKSEAARAKAKSYNRLIKKIRKRNDDWIAHANVALYTMLEDDYEAEPSNGHSEPYLSIFSKHLDPEQAILSPILFRLVTEASKAIEIIPQDPFADSYLFNSNKKRLHPFENQISVAFDDFMPLLRNNTPAAAYYEAAHANEKNAMNNKSHLKIINSSISNMKMNLRKHKSQGGMNATHNAHYDMISEEEATSSTSHHHHHEVGVVAAAAPIPPPPTIPSSAPLSSPVPATATTATTTTTTKNTLESESYTTQKSSRTLYSSSEDYNSSNSNKQSKHHQMKSIMKRVIKMGTVVPIKKTTHTSIY
jgi:hypothetical protein